ncbi:MAG: HAD family hydrolase [Armatimonadota bacterium]
MALNNNPLSVWFDLDDTLITTSKSLIAAVQASTVHLSSYYPGLTERDIANHSMDVWLTELGPETEGFSTLHKMQLSAFRSHIALGTLSRLGLSGVDTDALMRCSAQAEEQAWVCFPGVKHLLDSIQRQNIPIGLISNGPTALQNHKLTTCGLKDYFDHIVLDCEVGGSKPDSVIFTAAAKLMPAHRHVMVGNDPDADINGALRADWTAFWFTPGWFGETKPTEMGYIPIQHHCEILNHLIKG